MKLWYSLTLCLAVALVGCQTDTSSNSSSDAGASNQTTNASQSAGADQLTKVSFNVPGMT